MKNQCPPEALRKFDEAWEKKLARDMAQKADRDHSIRVGQSTLDGSFENPNWPEPAPAGWIPPWRRSEVEKRQRLEEYADEQAERCAVLRQRKSDSLYEKKVIDEEAELLLDKWLREGSEVIEATSHSRTRAGNVIQE